MIFLRCFVYIMYMCITTPFVFPKTWINEWCKKIQRQIHNYNQIQWVWKYIKIHILFKISFQLSNRLRNSRIMNGSTGNLLNNISAVNASSMQSVFTNSQPDQVNLPATQMFVDSGTVQGPANTVTAPISQSDVSNTVANGTSTIMSPVPQIMPVISLQNPTNLTPMDIQRIINMSNLNNGKQYHPIAIVSLFVWYFCFYFQEHASAMDNVGKS